MNEPSTLVRRLDGRAQFFDEAPLDASRSNLQKSADLFREAAREIERLTAAKNAAYLERNQVVAALASVFPSGIARTAIDGWDPEWHGCVYIDTPAGQCSWHFHDSQAHLFAHLPDYTKPWDGHSTEAKYERLASLTRAKVHTALGVAVAQAMERALRLIESDCPGAAADVLRAMLGGPPESLGVVVDRLNTLEQRLNVVSMFVCELLAPDQRRQLNELWKGTPDA